ncbi:hypothetical protein [Streptomyces sp. NPDC047097]|uniref:hypothetical protein n=1 Tax=Streptomyces sp. NPDC047097 TaxID=3155260 RepID=UPI003407E83B
MIRAVRARRRPIPLLVLALAAGALWWWAVLRLVLEPGQSGAVEATVAAGGWGLSLLPVHVAAARPRRPRLASVREWQHRRSLRPDSRTRGRTLLSQRRGAGPGPGPSWQPGHQ